MLFIPYIVEVPMERWPWANFLLIAVISLVSIAALEGYLTDAAIDAMILDGWALSGMLGSELLHADYIHLAGNMLFLWCFGNAVCAKVGNLWYVPLFAALALAGGAAHNLFVGGPAIGASDAINGVVGLFLVWYPLNNTRCLLLIIIYPFYLSITSYWLILVWLAFDIWGVAAGGGGVAYVAHLGGFAAGFAFGVFANWWGLIQPNATERDLFDLTGLPRRGERADHESEDLGEELLPNPAAARAQAQATAPRPAVAAPTAPPTADPMKFDCPACRRRLKVPPHAAGRRARCPHCAQILTVPAG